MVGLLNKIKPVTERLLSLLIVFLMIAAAAVWSGRLFGKPIDGDAAKTGAAAKVEAQLPSAEVLARLGLQQAQFAQTDSAAWSVEKGGKEIGTLICSTPYAAKVQGFAGPTPLYVLVDGEGKIEKIVPAENDETPDFFNAAADSLLPQWQGLPVEDAAAQKVDAVSGATYSSNAIINNVHKTLAARSGGTGHVHGAPAIGWGKTCAVLAVLLLGIVIAYRFKSVKWLRIVFHLLNVGVVGFWCGQFLSLSLLRGWIANGLDPLLYLPAVAMLIVAIALPYFGRPNHFCSYVCPYGSLQELAWLVPVPKVKLGANAAKFMKRMRFAVLCVLMLLLWAGVGLSLLDYEPFSAFLVTAAAPAVLVLAATFVVLGLFIPHPWCRMFCPVGSLLNLAEAKR